MSGEDFVAVVVRDAVDAVRLLPLDHLERLDEERVSLSGFEGISEGAEIGRRAAELPVGWCAWRSSAGGGWREAPLPTYPIWRFRFEALAGVPAAPRGAFVDAWIRSSDEASALRLARAELEDGLSPAVLLESRGCVDAEPDGQERVYYWQARFDGTCFVIHTWTEE